MTSIDIGDIGKDQGEVSNSVTKNKGLRLVEGVWSKNGNIHRKIAHSGNVKIAGVHTLGEVYNIAIIATENCNILGWKREVYVGEV